MTLQYSVDLRNAQLDQVETIVGTEPVLEIRTGSPPVNCAAADTGAVLATLLLPSDWMADADNGSKVKSGTWEDASADDTGIAGHWRLKANGGTPCHLQGTVTATGGGGDMTVDSVNFVEGQTFTVTTFTISAGNA
jgi:hypothetical protein